MAQSRREQLQAYRFMQRRVRTALLDRDPDTNDAPLARMGGATYAGIMIAILVLAGAGIFGIIDRGGSTAWKKPGTLIVERESGTLYVYLHKVLYQVQNKTSAQLILGTSLSPLVVAHNSLRGAPLGGIAGIHAAPPEVPAAKAVVGGAWSVCTAGDLTSLSTVAMQIQPGITAKGTTFAPGRGMLLRAPEGTFLLAQNHTYLVPAKWQKATRYLTSIQGVNVSNEFIASIPRGQTLQPVRVAGFGGRGVTLGVGGRGTKVGQVLQDNSQRNQYYLVVPDGLALLTPLQATLQLADPATQALQGHTTRAISIDSDALTGVSTSRPLPQTVSRAQQAPPSRPAPVTPTTDEQVCVVYPASVSAAPTVVYGKYVPVPFTAGFIRLPNGAGAVVQSSSAPPGGTPATYFVSDGGLAFPIDSDGLNQLGLESVAVAHVPGLVLNAIPLGPTLTPAAAYGLANGGRIPALK